MPRDCYALVFKPVFNQARADGLSEAVATAAAQAAMADCLKQQSTVVPAVRATALRSEATSGTNTSVPTGASMTSPATVNSARPANTR